MKITKFHLWAFGIIFFTLQHISGGLIYSQTLEVYPVTIEFDYESGQEYDAISLSDDEGDPAIIPEYNLGHHNNPIAYIMGQEEVNIKVEFEDANEYSGMAFLLLRLTKSGGSGNEIGSINNLCIPNYQFGTTKTITLTSNIPNQVGKHSFIWKWEIYAIPVNSPNQCVGAGWNTEYTEHIYYTLLSTPLAPMAQPWTGVLDLACNWASGDNWDLGIIKDLTEGLYNCGVTYNQGVSHTSGYTNLNLGSLLSGLDNPSNVAMDCKDFSNFLQVLNRSLGVSCNYLRIAWRPDYPPLLTESEFVHNYLLPAGYDEDEDEEVEPNNWYFHMVCWFNSQVADASTQLDNDFDPHSPGFDWKLFNAYSNCSLSAYLQKLSLNSIDTTGSGVCTVY